ncbi:MAG: hypothetical protein QUV06_09145 [Cyanobium sp. CZS 48M]|nr:hypothetical protein [Cyanobium sp. CZS48M]
MGAPAGAAPLLAAARRSASLPISSTVMGREGGLARGAASPFCSSVLKP